MRELWEISAVKTERASLHKFIHRLKFQFWQLKEELDLKIYLFFLTHFGWDLAKEDEDDLENSDNEEDIRSFMEKIEQEEKEYVAAAPHFEPRRTALFYGKKSEYGCNFITTRKYEKYIISLYAQAISWGMTTFVVDYATPFGALAFEILLALRAKGEIFQLYLFQSEPHSRRKSFRLIPETDRERVLLAQKADYYYNYLYPKNNIIEYFISYAGVIFTQRDFYVSKIHIPQYLLDAWGLKMRT